MNKTCTSCKFEPDWEPMGGPFQFYGFCKNLPAFMVNGPYFYKVKGSVSCQTDGYEDPVAVKECKLWEANNAQDRKKMEYTEMR